MRLDMSLQGKAGSETLDPGVSILSQMINAIHASPDIIKNETTKAEFQATDWPASWRAATSKAIAVVKSAAPIKSTLWIVSLSKATTQPVFARFFSGAEIQQEHLVAMLP